MKTIKHLARITVGLAVIAICSLAVPILNSLADEVPTPVISMTVTNTNQLSITITNGVGFANYELYRRPLLDAAFPWAWRATGGLGQTNFIVEMGLENIGFFQVAVGNNWDGDEALNHSDADPSNPSIGYLSITIDNPIQGAVLE